MEAETFECAGDAAAFLLSRLPHSDSAADAGRAAFVDAATGRALSFAALRRAALSLASALRLGLGLRRGDAVLLLLSPEDDPLLLPPILLGVLAAGCVVVAAHPDAAAHASGAAIVVAGPEAAKKVAGVIAAPLLLTSRSLDPRRLSAEELMDGGDPASALDALAADQPGPWDAAIVVYSSAGGKPVMTTHADLVAAVAAAGASSQDEGRVCLASLPAWGAGVHGGLPLLALGLPAAGVTTVLLPPSADLRDAVATHGATDLVVTPEAAAVLAASMAPQGKLAGLRRVTVVAPAPLADDARQEFRRRLPWVELTVLSDAPETETAAEQVQVAPAELGALLLGQPETASPLAIQIQHKGKMADQMSATNEATSLVAPLQKKIQKTVMADILAKSIAGKFLRKHPVASDKQAVSKL
ncbi:putative 4-coumarate--CoA ligase-like 8 [Lolium perenne]|uniref:putative 4-coumarate--CoA ligase-like 8 n=1 Tax=Lolium perenne TaxID=4522 RepID=UPI0021EA2B56|nr:4-coumarate--CoA ligase-like 3 [Lolium perenne]